MKPFNVLRYLCPCVRMTPDDRAWGVVPLALIRMDGEWALAEACASRVLHTPPHLWLRDSVELKMELSRPTWHYPGGRSIVRHNVLENAWAYWPHEPALVGFTEAQIKPEMIALVVSDSRHVQLHRNGWRCSWAQLRCLAVVDYPLVEPEHATLLRLCPYTPIVRWDGDRESPDPFEPYISEYKLFCPVEEKKR